MAKTKTTLSLDEQFAVLDLGWFIPRILAPDVNGFLTRATLIGQLTNLQEADATDGIDKTARGGIARLLESYSTQAKQPGVDATARQAVLKDYGLKLRNLLYALPPEEVGQLLDDCIPPREIEARGGKVGDRLQELINRRDPSKNPIDATDGGEVRESSMHFSEANANRLLKRRKLSAETAERIVKESLIVNGYSRRGPARMSGRKGSP